MSSVLLEADLGAPVRTCPGWTVRDLVRHLGGVHRWATGFVRGEGRQPKDGDLEELVRALAGASPDLETWTFLDAPSPLAFWARRQAHETAIHRVDAESAIDRITGFSTPFAVDGIDELLLRFVARGGPELPVDRDRTLLVEATDVDRRWRVTFTPSGFRTAGDGGAGSADTLIRASASDLYLGLWNRRAFEPSAIVGDEHLAQLQRTRQGSLELSRVGPTCVPCRIGGARGADAFGPLARRCQVPPDA
jgi:uncharacterized protein (TIGR03083 family)